jgi:hypothetical protein
MAKQNSLLKIQGTIGGMTFYHTKDGNLVREKGGVSKKRIANDPAFQRTRENGQEFGMAGKSGKMVRDAIRSFMQNASDSKVTSRLTQVMSYILKEDKFSARGERNVAAGIKTPEGKAFLKHFNFNINSLLGSVLFRPILLDPISGTVTIRDLVATNNITAPAGATHVSLQTAFASIDFATGKASVEYAEPANIPLDAVVRTIQLVPDAVPAQTPDTTALHFLLVEFFQEVNGVQYSLKNGAFNCLEIIEVE